MKTVAAVVVALVVIGAIVDEANAQTYSYSAPSSTHSQNSARDQ